MVVDEVEVPALSYGQVLVRIYASRICGSQLGEIAGVKGPDRYLPHLLGHEAGATVIEVGPEVRQVKPGDRVVCHWRPGKGIDARPAVYDWKGRKVNAGGITTFQNFSVISENRLTVVPTDTDFELCCLLADTLTTGFGVISNDARLKLGESAVIIGCGGIGLGVLLGAKLAGACPIIAVDLYEHKLQTAARYGATHIINSGKTDFVAKAREILEGEPADVVVDGTGSAAVLEKAGAAWVVQERDLDVPKLAKMLERILTDSEGLSACARAARGLGHTDAAQRLADLAEQIAP